MSPTEALTLAVLQGLTEFLPVSSSGHLAIASALFRSIGAVESGPDGLFFAVMLHVGTLAAILVYYRRDARADARQLISGGPGRSKVVRNGFLAVVATLPAVVVGLTLKDSVDEAFQSVLVPGYSFLITAALLLATSRIGEGTKGPSQTTWRDALLVGLAQAVAITPGISRSGSTIAAGLALGFSRSWAVGFSLLMAVPAILGAAVLEVRDLDGRSLTPVAIALTAASTALSGLVGYGAIVWLVRIVRSGRLWYFSVYLVLLSAAVLGTSSLGVWSGSGTESGGTTVGQGRRSETLDGPPGVELDRSGEIGPGRGDLDHGDAAGPRSTGPPPGTLGGSPRPIVR
ncbi:undecaprenyl-diphosphate phosphatase [Tautonia plasticadhaerens]|uniref:Undecaprenyl-diphosphatase n=1 Tax=Tautonia plasticadhaerens TaxID=2527974 RepID=A0A518GXE7_9BACT|nr:undecaprenyl-diphosphate phosphatase [Tautonia plasticadhaerens]QDV33260.1 Undecaprenyl-diphosphatase [Tautonia plasticadhaerens]